MTVLTAPSASTPGARRPAMLRRAHRRCRVLMAISTTALLLGVGVTACQHTPTQHTPTSRTLAEPALAANASAPVMPAGLAATAPAHVVRVVDGDTIVVDRSDGDRVTVRLLGMDTPETVKPHTPIQPCGPQASARTKALAPPGTAVHLESDSSQADLDRYGRTLAYVWIGENMLDYDLVAEGLARTYIYDHVPGHYAADLARAQTRAQAAHLGLWGGPCSQ